MLRVTVCSEFFCDPELWLQLEQDFLPALASAGGEIRAMCCGCGPGMEPYGLAILLEDAGLGGRYRIEAIDCNASCIDAARIGGPFAVRDLRNVIESERPRFFDMRDDGVFVLPALRDRVDFRVDDIRRAALAGPYDLILYRNVEPHFGAAENTAVCGRLYDALRPGGILFVSNVDRLGGWREIGFERPRAGFFRRPVPAPGAGP